jgi:hypothetical protein
MSCRMLCLIMSVDMYVFVVTHMLRHFVQYDESAEWANFPQLSRTHDSCTKYSPNKYIPCCVLRTASHPHNLSMSCRMLCLSECFLCTLHAQAMVRYDESVVQWAYVSGMSNTKPASGGALVFRGKHASGCMIYEQTAVSHYSMYV